MHDWNDIHPLEFVVIISAMKTKSALSFFACFLFRDFIREHLESLQTSLLV